MEDKIIEFVRTQPSWEDVIRKIVVEERMDPWRIDIARLADRFIEILNEMRTHDLKIPARFILVAAILLKMKSEVLCEEEEEEKEDEEVMSGHEVEEIERLYESLPELEISVDRSVRRDVGIEELINALKEYFRQEERKMIKRKLSERQRRALEEAVVLEDSTLLKLDELLERIRALILELEREEIAFSTLVGEWRRENVVRTFIPLLHLSTEGKVRCRQESLFGEIYIRVVEEVDNSCTSSS
jgi:segregation and condensation protein A